MLYALSLLRMVLHHIFLYMFLLPGYKEEYVVLHMSCVPIECATRDRCRPWTRFLAQACSLDVSTRLLHCHAIEYAQGTVDAIANRASMRKRTGKRTRVDHLCPLGFWYVARRRQSILCAVATSNLARLSTALKNPAAT